MRTLLRSFVLILMLCAARSLMAEEAVTFTKKPTAINSVAGAKISFAVSSFTDVTIYIEDDKGKVIRHLASGLLGKIPRNNFKQTHYHKRLSGMAKPTMVKRPKGPLKSVLLWGWGQNSIKSFYPIH